MKAKRDWEQDNFFGVSLLQRKGSLRAKIAKLPLPLRYGLYVGVFFAIILLGVPTQSQGGGFLYAQF